MEKDMQQIWNLLDGGLAPEEQHRIKQRLASDPAFHTLYEKILDLEGRLREMPPSAAPADLVDAVMDGIHIKASGFRNRSTFAGLWKILVSIGLVIVGFSALAWAYAGNSDTGSSMQPLAGLLNGFSMDINLEGITFLPYTLVVVCALFLVWLDNTLRLNPARQRWSPK